MQRYPRVAATARAQSAQGGPGSVPPAWQARQRGSCEMLSNERCPHLTRPCVPASLLQTAPTPPQLREPGAAIPRTFTTTGSKQAPGSAEDRGETEAGEGTHSTARASPATGLTGYQGEGCQARLGDVTVSAYEFTCGCSCARHPSVSRSSCAHSCA